MDELIRQYIDIKFDGYMHDEIIKGFDLFNKFNYLGHSEDYINLLMSDSDKMPEDTQDEFISIFMQQVDYIISSHLISLNSEATLPESVEIMSFLYEVQDLHDYNQLHTLIDSTNDEYEALALIINDFTNIEVSRAMQIIDDIDAIFFSKLKDYIVGKATYTTDSLPRFSDIGKEIIHNMRHFISYTKEENLLGEQLMNAGVLLNQPIPSYQPYIHHVFEKMADEKKPHNMLSLLYLTKEGVDKPVDLYSDVAHLFMNDLNKISIMKSKIADIVSHYNSYLEAKREEARLSKISRTE